MIKKLTLPSKIFIAIILRKSAFLKIYIVKNLPSVKNISVLAKSSKSSRIIPIMLILDGHKELTEENRASDIVLYLVSENI